MYKVTIGSFNQVERNDLTERYIIDDKNLKEAICIDYKDYMIDINNGNMYPTIKRQNNRIIKEQNIVLDQEYALYVHEYKANMKEHLLGFRSLLTRGKQLKR